MAAVFSLNREQVFSRVFFFDLAFYFLKFHLALAFLALESVHSVSGFLDDLTQYFTGGTVRAVVASDLQTVDFATSLAVEKIV